MSAVIFNGLTLNERQQSHGSAETVKGSNAFESLLQHNIGNNRYGNTSQISFEVVSNFNEQKAFATHVLSYVDVVSVKLDKNVKTDNTTLSKLYNLPSIGGSSAEVMNTEAVAEGPLFSLPGDDARRSLFDQKESKVNRFFPVFFRNLYEKIKVSIFGVNEKTVLVRDYYTNHNYSSADFKLNLDDTDMQRIKKLFHNGVEK